MAAENGYNPTAHLLTKENWIAQEEAQNNFSDRLVSTLPSGVNIEINRMENSKRGNNSWNFGGVFLNYNGRERYDYIANFDYELGTGTLYFEN